MLPIQDLSKKECLDNADGTILITSLASLMRSSFIRQVIYSGKNLAFFPLVRAYGNIKASRGSYSDHQVNYLLPALNTSILTFPSLLQPMQWFPLGWQLWDTSTLILVATFPFGFCMYRRIGKILYFA